ncbi:13787_t:CDS:1 [Cetraspora pellucida]|uniref:13787_t:CDS:1 n=1 Tax=Cetraspora pellucida TaxID=1433469 RepID=A0A9N9AUI4_9GLOM|nr:13787_t:CDS:1 [Cetraspora pellucida]
MTLETNESKKETIIRNNLSFDSYKPLIMISLKPISLKHQTQLFKDIHPYIHDPHKDELCFASNENNRNSDSNLLDYYTSTMYINNYIPINSSVSLILNIMIVEP